MTDKINSTRKKSLLIAVDIAKYKHIAMAEFNDGTKSKMTFDNSAQGFALFEERFKIKEHDLQVAIEPTGDYHRSFAHFLIKKNVTLKQVNTLAMARIREALHNSWDKNDPKDAQVILHMLKNNHTQTFYDYSETNIGGLKELAGLHFRLTKTKTKLQHTILNHYFPLYFPEGKNYFQGSKVRWFSRFLQHYPLPACVLQTTEDQFVKDAWDYLHRVPYRDRILRSFYKACESTIGIPVASNSLEAQSMKAAFEDHCSLMDRLKLIENQVCEVLKEDRQFQILISIPGVGPISALNIIAESGNIKRFKHSKQYLKYMGLNLCSSQSGTYQSQKSISKRGNSRLRSMLWMCTKSAIYSASADNPFK